MRQAKRSQLNLRPWKEECAARDKAVFLAKSLKSLSPRIGAIEVMERLREALAESVNDYDIAFAIEAVFRPS